MVAMHGLQLNLCVYVPRLPPSKVLSIIDAGPDFTSNLRDKLESFNAGSGGSAASEGMWAWRQRKDGTTRAVNIYRGEYRK